MTKPGVLFRASLRVEPKTRTEGRQFPGEVTPRSESEGLGQARDRKREKSVKAGSRRGQPGPSPAGEPPETLRILLRINLRDKEAGPVTHHLPSTVVAGLPCTPHTSGSRLGPRDLPAHLCHADRRLK